MYILQNEYITRLFINYCGKLLITVIKTMLKLLKELYYVLS